MKGLYLFYYYFLLLNDYITFSAIIILLYCLKIFKKAEFNNAYNFYLGSFVKKNKKTEKNVLVPQCCCVV